MKTNTNIKRRVKHSIKHRAQRKYKTHKNKHTKTQLKQYKTHKGGAVNHPGKPQILFSSKLLFPKSSSKLSSFFSRSSKQTNKNYSLYYNKEIVEISPDNINQFIDDHTTILKKTSDFKNNNCSIIMLTTSTSTHSKNKILDFKLIYNAINIISEVFIYINQLIIDCACGTGQSIKNMLVTLPKSITNLLLLEFLTLTNCETLTKLPDDIEKLYNLRNIKLVNCNALTTLPNNINKLNNLEKLVLIDCHQLTTLPETPTKLTNLHLEKCYALKILPDTIGNLKELTQLNLIGCINLTTLPHTIGKLQNLQQIDLHGSTIPITIFTLPLTILLLTSLTTLSFTSLRLENPEILYLMPNIKLSEDDAALYLINIGSKDYYKNSISNMFDMLNLNPVDKDYYLKNIPYNLDLKLSIKEQLDIFKGLRTKF